MKDLTKLAKGEECQIRCPTECNGDPTTTVACHVRLIGISGAGYKSPDLFIAFGCSNCHAVVDGQHGSSYSYEQRRLMLVEGMIRTQQLLIDKGVLRW